MTLKINGSQPINNQTGNFTEQSEKEKLRSNSVAENEAAIAYLANNNPATKVNHLNFDSEDKKTVGDFLRKIKTEQPFDDEGLAKREVRVLIDVKKPTNQATVADYDKAAWRAIFQKAGYGMLTDQEIALAVGGMNAVGWTVNDSGFDLASLRKEDDKPGAMVLKTNQAIIERVKCSGQAVLQYQNYTAKQADLQKQLAESQTNQMLLDPLRLGGNVPVRWVERNLNILRDLLQQLDKGEILPFSGAAKSIGQTISEKITGQPAPKIPTASESIEQLSGITLPAVPEIKLERPLEYKTEKYKREGNIGEDLGATALDLFLLKCGITNSKINSPQSLKITDSVSNISKSAVIAETGNLRSPISINAIEVPRTPNLPKITTMEELLKIKGIPGSEGVVLNQKVVKNTDIWKLSNQNGIEYALTRENGKFILRSGALDKVGIPKNIRPVLHTHPPDELGRFSKLPSKADIDKLNRIWERNPNGSRPASIIIWGSETNQVTIFRATGPFDNLK